MKNESSQYTLKKYSQVAASFATAKLGLLLIRHPIRVIETNKQAFPNISNSQLIKNIYNNQGIKGFYQSTLTSIFRVLLSESYRGPLMIEVPSYVGRHLKNNAIGNEHILIPLIATPLISSIDAALTCPLLRMSTHQVTYGKKISLVEIASDYFKKNAFKQFYRGFSPLLIQTANSWGVFLILDDLSKFIIKKHCGEISYSALTLSSILGGPIQTMMNVAPDTIRVQMQKSDNTSQGLVQSTKNIIKTNGRSALFFALPHKFLGSIVAYGYKSFLREYWTNKDAVNATSNYNATGGNPTFFAKETTKIAFSDYAEKDKAANSGIKK